MKVVGFPINPQVLSPQFELLRTKWYYLKMRVVSSKLLTLKYVPLAWIAVLLTSLTTKLLMIISIDLRTLAIILNLSTIWLSSLIIYLILSSNQRSFVHKNSIYWSHIELYLCLNKFLMCLKDLPEFFVNDISSYELVHVF